MRNQKIKRLEKKLLKVFKEDKDTDKTNSYNETVLTKTIKQVIDKNKAKPISTRILLK